jgi:hypothetical protein
LAFLWALHRAGSLGTTPIVLCGSIWPDLMAALTRAGALERAQAAATDVCAGARDAVDRVADRIGAASREVRE